MAEAADPDNLQRKDYRTGDASIDVTGSGLHVHCNIQSPTPAPTCDRALIVQVQIRLINDLCLHQLLDDVLNRDDADRHCNALRSSLHTRRQQRHSLKHAWQRPTVAA
jgi:hypothetical protein